MVCPGDQKSSSRGLTLAQMSVQGVWIVLSWGPKGMSGGIIDSCPRVL